METELLSKVVASFYENEKIKNQTIGRPIFDIIKKILGPQYAHFNNVQLCDELCERFKVYFQENNAVIPNFSQELESFKTNISNWNSNCYKGIKGNYIKSVDRTSILSLAFILGVSDIVCNELLTSINEHPLHYGDLSENIVIYCLQENKPFSFGIRMYECFTFLERKITSKIHIGTPSYSTRSKFVQEQMQSLPKQENTMVEEIKLNVKEWEEQNSIAEPFTNKDIETLIKLLLLKEHFSRVSNKTMSQVYRNIQINNMSSRSFIKRIFSSQKIDIILEQKEAQNLFIENSLVHNKISALHRRLFTLLETCLSFDEIGYIHEFSDIIDIVNQMNDMAKTLPKHSLTTQEKEFIKKYKILLKDKVQIQLEKTKKGICLKGVCVKALKSATTISNTFTKLEKTLKQKNNAHPTRTYVILMSISSWCLMETTKTLAEYVNEVLQSCKFRSLDEQYAQDRFVNELNNFKYNYRSHNITYNYLENGSNREKLIGKFKKKSEAYGVILTQYLNHKNNIFSGFDWINTKQFFDFACFQNNRNEK